MQNVSPKFSYSIHLFDYGRMSVKEFQTNIEILSVSR